VLVPARATSTSVQQPVVSNQRLFMTYSPEFASLQRVVAGRRIAERMEAETRSRPDAPSRSSRDVSEPTTAP
jgi:hypothetical protein